MFLFANRSPPPALFGCLPHGNSAPSGGVRRLALASASGRRQDEQICPGEGRNGLQPCLLVPSFIIRLEKFWLRHCRPGLAPKRAYLKRPAIANSPLLPKLATAPSQSPPRRSRGTARARATECARRRDGGVAGVHGQGAAPAELPQRLAYRPHQRHPGGFPILLSVAVVRPMRLLHAPQACSLPRHVEICVLRRVHAMQRQVRREQMPRTMPRNRGVPLLRQLGCFDQVPAAGRVQHPDDPVRQLHHQLHVLPPAAGLHLLPGRLHRRQPGALRGFAGDLLRLRHGLLDGLLLYADAAQGGDGQEGRQAGRGCDDGPSDAADVAHRSADAASGRVCAAASVQQVVLWDLGLPLRVGNGWRSSS
ncbi:uncharacterized protein [Triticum aestivum]|uniref:uncharacterized protein isoform X2 n=1 Tax=Triticum aestivum TaxID=4565 RepID=UPI001D029A2B|nr:uncharacterized protein LOC123128284 isoform X2 [Triticum aestivum]